MKIHPGTFTIGDPGLEEKFKLSGEYDTKVYEYWEDVDPASDCHSKTIQPSQLVFGRGNVLRRVDTEGIDDLIRLFIRYTHDPCKDIEHELDRSVATKTQKFGGTIRPTKKVLFVYRGKVFVAYGRYIFGYDHSGYEILRRQSYDGGDDDDDGCLDDDDDEDWEDVSDESEEEDDELYDIDKEEGNSVITDEKIRLNGPRKSPRTFSDYFYSFIIYDQKTKILDAFCLYR